MSECILLNQVMHLLSCEGIMTEDKELIPLERLQSQIFMVRGHRVMLSTTLAALYGVVPKVLIQAVKRNISRFPADFAFPLEWREAEILRSQFVTLRLHGRHPKYPPYAFTEQGVAMLSSVLRSERAVQVNIAIMRVFVRLREMLSAHKELSIKLAELERKISGHDESIQALFGAIRQLMAPPEKPKRQIGFHVREKRSSYRRR